MTAFERLPGESDKEMYARYLCSPEWWAKRNAVMDRSGGKCEKCFAEADHVHHLTYIRKYDERLDDLQAVCERCHDRIHNPAKEQPYYGFRELAERVPDPNNPFPADLTPFERELFELMLLSPQIAPVALERIPPDFLTTDIGKQLFSVFQQLEFSGQSLKFESVLESLKGSKFCSLIVSLHEQAKAKSRYTKDEPLKRMKVLTERIMEHGRERIRQTHVNRLEKTELPPSEELDMLQDVIRAGRLRQNGIE